MFRQWTALELAVHNQWGGPNSAQHADELVNNIMDLFDTAEKIYKDDVSLILDDVMEAHFNTICEDESTDELGHLMCVMFNELCVGNMSMLERTLTQERSRPGAVTKSVGIENGDELDSDEEMEENRANNGDISSVFTSALAAAQPVAGTGTGTGDGDGMEMEEEAPTEPAAPRVDADGWETVVKSGRKKKPK